MTLLPPINGRPLQPASYRFSNARNVECAVNIASESEGMIEFWCAELTVSAEWIVVENAVQFAARVRAFIAELLEQEPDPDLRAIVEDVLAGKIDRGEAS